MRYILILLCLLNVNIFAAYDCGVNVFNIATGKLYKKFLRGNQVHPKNRDIASKRCITDVSKNDDDINSFNIVAKCEFEIGDKLYNRTTKDYQDADNSEWIIATYSYNMFAYEIICENN